MVKRLLLKQSLLHQSLLLLLLQSLMLHSYSLDQFSAKKNEKFYREDEGFRVESRTKARKNWGRKSSSGLGENQLMVVT